MKSKKIFIVFSVVLLVLSAYLILTHEEKKTHLLYVLVQTDNSAEKISCWQNDDGEFFVFLPGYADLSKAALIRETESEIWIDGKQIHTGMQCDVFRLNTALEFEYITWGQNVKTLITFVQSDKIATMHIETASGNMEYIHEKKGNAEKGNMRIYAASGELEYAGELDSINGRGNATWNTFEKKPYSLKLAAEADLLGMGAAQKWILLANAGDTSHMRNKIVYDFARRIGLAFSPDSQWVDLYLNGEYAGLYLLSERNEIHTQRVDISQTGSFLVSVELEERLKAQNILHTVTEEKQALRIHYPEQLSGSELSQLSQRLQAMENAVVSQDGFDPLTGQQWQDLIDVDSWVKKYLIEEVFGSIDAGLVSQYFYYDGDDPSSRIYAGPVWDYDNAMGNRECWEILQPKMLVANQTRGINGFYAPWFSALYQKELFYNKIVDTYAEQFLPYLETELKEDMYAYARHIAASAEMNQIRWSLTDNTFEEEIAYILTYMERRAIFLSDLWCHGGEYCYVKANQGHSVNYAVCVGETLDELFMFKDTEVATFMGWYYSDTDEPFDITQPITEDIEIYAKWETKSTNKITKSTNKIKQILKLAPLGCIAIIGVGLVWIEFKRMRKSR